MTITYNFRFLAASIILLAGIQEGLLIPSVGNNNEHLKQIIDVGALLNRLDRLEASRDHQQAEIDQLKKENSYLKDQLQISQKTSSKKAATRKPSSCLDLLDLGHTLTGFYDVLPVGNSQIASIYCDFGLQPTEADFETRVGFVDVKTSPVHFFVTRTSPWTTTDRTIPYEKEYLNLGGGMNLTSGVFTAPQAGTYAFTFTGPGDGTGSNYRAYGYVRFYWSGEVIAIGTSRMEHSGTALTGGVGTIVVHSILKLNKGDTVWIHLKDGSVYANSESHIQFMGSLLQEDLVIS